MPPETRLVTLPNALSALRGVMGLVVVGLIAAGGTTLLVLALAVMVAAEALDAVDGAVARRMGLATPLGEVADSLFDSVYHLSVFVAFLVVGWMPAWMLFVIFLPELAIPYVRTFVRQSGHDLANDGRLKTAAHAAAQLGVVALALAGAAGSIWVDALLLAAMAGSVYALVERGLAASRLLTP